MDALVNINGQILPPVGAKVSVFDRGFLFGDGVYETGRTFERCPLYLEEHLARLRRSAGKLAIPVPYTDEEIKARLFATARAFDKPDIYYRMILTRGAAPEVGLDAGRGGDPTFVILVQDLSGALEAKARKGMALLTSKIIRNAAQAQDPNIKTSNYLNSLLALQDVRARGGEDAVMGDAEGRVTEGTTFSIFAVTRERVLRTPSLSVGILDSITRRHVLELAAPDVKIEEGFFPLAEFQSATEVFVASSVRGILPARSWDGHPYPVPGPVTTLLQRRLVEATRRYIATRDKF